MRTFLSALAVLVLVSWTIGTRAVTAGFGTITTISIAKLSIQDNADPAKYKLSFNSKDPNVLAVNFALMPQHGTHFNLCNVNAVRCSAFLLLPASGWAAVKKGFKYSDKTGANGPVRSIRVADGKLALRLAGAGFNFPLLGQPAPQGTLGFALWNDPPVPVVCAQVPGSLGQVKKDSPDKGSYVAVKAEAPAVCSNIVLD